MVSWSELTSIIARNSDRGACVRRFSLISAGHVERFSIHGPAAATTAVAPTLSILETSTAEPVPFYAPKSKPVAAAVEEPVVINEPVKKTETIKEPVSQKHVIDPVVLGIENTEPLYLGATRRMQHQMEIEEAQRLEAKLDELYKSASGRSRGWTKVGLEGMIKPRCSSGGDIKELDRAKKPFLWPVVSTDKPTSAFLDFVCVAKKIRVAVWFAEEKKVVLYPAADAAVLDASDKSVFPLYHVDSTGHPRHGMPECETLLKFCDTAGWTLIPPASVLHTLSGLTLSELESVGKKLGMAVVEGSKAERVTAIAAYKLRQRLTAA